MYRNAFYRHGKRFRVIPILEKELYGAYHWHCSLERPIHLSEFRFMFLVNETWSETHWADERTSIKFNSDAGWELYMLKAKQKGGLKSWLDCIDWDCFFNPTVDV